MVTSLCKRWFPRHSPKGFTNKRRLCKSFELGLIIYRINSATVSMCSETVPLEEGSDKETTIVILKIRNEDFDSH